MRVPRVIAAVPAHLVNGCCVALGIALIQAVVAAVGGFGPALIASGAGIAASLADHPTTPRRTWLRVLTAATVGCLSGALVMGLRTDTVALGVATVVLGLLSSMALAWGPRAGPVSFAALLALVFAMAAPPAVGWHAWLAYVGWSALGAALYVAWALACSVLLQPRYRRLALASALEATAELLRSRADLLTADASGRSPSGALQDWIGRQTVLDERLQAARDLLFARPDAPGASRQIATLWQAVDLRDSMLWSQLDLELLGDDAAAQQCRDGLSASLRDIGDGLDRVVAVLRAGRPLLAPATDAAQRPAEQAVRALLQALPTDTADARVRLARAALGRVRHMVDDLARLQRALHGEQPPDRLPPVPLPAERAELQLFVSAEGWPLKALRRHLTIASPVLRHALRTGAALGAAYALAHALPWSAHPQWLVLSVAVVLRGNLEQTLSRRNARVAGTVLGCCVVAVLALFAQPAISTAAFLLGVGIAHAFVQRRYLVAAVGATVMALLQAHLSHPGGGYGVAERVADTLIGALLAWAFSYVLPWWERRDLQALVARVLAALGALSQQVLRWRDDSASDLPLRLARREVYEALDALAAAAQRSSAEPDRVRLPLPALSQLLVHCHALLAQLAAVKTLLMRRADELDPSETASALQATAATLAGLLGAAAAAAPVRGAAAGSDSVLPADAALAPPSGDMLMGWLRRRLHMATLAAAEVGSSARLLQP